jgi:hypothetical protein
VAISIVLGFPNAHLHTQPLHQSSISKADSTITQGINARARVVTGTSTGLICDSKKLEPIAGDCIHEVRAFHHNRLNSEGGRAKRKERDLDTTSISKSFQDEIVLKSHETTFDGIAHETMGGGVLLRPWKQAWGRTEFPTLFSQHNCKRETGVKDTSGSDCVEEELKRDSQKVGLFGGCFQR